jgi:hypothetical protein
VFRVTGVQTCALPISSPFTQEISLRIGIIYNF